jgi:hypothetical protein
MPLLGWEGMACQKDARSWGPIPVKFPKLNRVKLNPAFCVDQVNCSRIVISIRQLADAS